MGSNMRYKEIADHYENCFKEYGDNHKGVDWPNEEDAQLRYQVMHDLMRSTEGIKLLDLGCGAGHFLEFLMTKYKPLPMEYIGSDISEVFINHCKGKFPDYQWRVLDLLQSETIDPVDYVVMNGVFTEKLSSSFDEMWEFFTAMLSKAWLFSKEGMAFNVMSTQVDWQRDDLFHVPLDRMADFVSTKLSRHFTIRRDYGLYEYTVYVYKQPIK